MKSNHAGFSLKIFLPILTTGILTACGGGSSEPAPTATYTLTSGQREEIIKQKQHDPVYSYKQYADVATVSSLGANADKYILTIRPPRNATALFAEGQPGSGLSIYIGTGVQHTALNVQCGTPDPAWSADNTWAERGALQLWSQDPLSGVAKTMLGEVILSCALMTELNDTGIVELDSGLPSVHHDALLGRDFSAMQGNLNKVGASTPNNGKTNGFDYTKIGHNGTPLAIQNATWNYTGSEAAGTQWDCVKDNVTGLFWENKSDDYGLRDIDWSYVWYDSNSATNGGGAGTESGGSCFQSGRCDTEKYVADVNAASLCGFNDWRLPSKNELNGLIDYGRTRPSIDIGFFPNTRAGRFWSSSIYAYNTDYAWYVTFVDGSDSPDIKLNSNSVRLVRGQ